MQKSYYYLGQFLGITFVTKSLITKMNTNSTYHSHCRKGSLPSHLLSLVVFPAFLHPSPLLATPLEGNHMTWEQLEVDLQSNNQINKQCIDPHTIGSYNHIFGLSACKDLYELKFSHQFSDDVIEAELYFHQLPAQSPAEALQSLRVRGTQSSWGYDSSPELQVVFTKHSFKHHCHTHTAYIQITTASRQNNISQMQE